MGEHTKNKTNKKNKNKRNKNIKYNYIQLWRLKLLQPAAWAIRASIMIALTKTSPPNCNMIGLRIFGKGCYQNNCMLLIALLVETELRQARGLDDRSHVDRRIYICAPRAAKLPMPRSAGWLVPARACCTPTEHMQLDRGVFRAHALDVVRTA